MKRTTTVILWFMVWGGLYAGSYNFWAPDFPSSPISYFNGLRAFAPLIAAYVAIIILLRRGAHTPLRLPLRGPLGLLTLYGLTGIVSVLFSPEPLTALYWSAAYLAVLVVLWASLSDLRLLIFMNRAIAILMTFFFLLGPLRPQLIAIMETGRSSISSFAINIGVMGLGPVTANGIGRFAAIAAIAALLWMGQSPLRNRLFWILVLLVSLLTLAICKSRTALFGLGLALVVILWLSQKRRGIILTAVVYAFLIWISLYQWSGQEIPSTHPPVSQEVSPGGQVEAVEPGSESGVEEVSPGGQVELVKPGSKGSLEVVLGDIFGRYEAWKKGLDLLPQSPLLGFGFQADRFLLAHRYANHMSNSYFQALIQTGVVGTLFFLAAFVWMWILALRLLVRPRVYSSEVNRLLIVEALALVAFFTFRSLFESTAAFYGVDLIMLAPIIAFLQTCQANPDQGIGRVQT